MSRFSRLLVLTIMVLSVCAPVIADDLNPPPWRGQPGTTLQEWEFNTPMVPVAPNRYFNPYGVPSAMAWPGTGQYWVEEYAGRQGIWPLSGTIEATIPNVPITNPWKDIWVQITWMPQVPGTYPVVWEKRFDVTATKVTEYPLGGGWIQGIYAMRIFPNPDWEIVRIDGTILVDQLVIDTQCVPEPSSLLALLGGAAGMIGFTVRRRR